MRFSLHCLFIYMKIIADARNAIPLGIQNRRATIHSAIERAATQLRWRILNCFSTNPAPMWMLS